MIFTPYTIGGRELVDGGLLAPVPIAATRQTPADFVVAVDVNARSARPLVSPEAGDSEDEPHEADTIEIDGGLRARLSAWMGKFQ